MNAILLIGHAPLASALRDAALHVLPDAAAALLALDVYPDMPRERTADVARTLLATRGRGGTLVLTDVLGATPCNVATELLAERGVRLLAGMNLPMLLRALTYRGEPLDQMAERALAGGVRGILAVAPADVPADANCALHDS